jgi:hypothetical protein
LCDAKVRGRLVSTEPLFVGLGIQVAYWLDCGVSRFQTSVAWRVPLGVQMVPAFVSKSTAETCTVLDMWRQADSSVCHRPHLWSARVTALALPTRPIGGSPSGPL